MKREPHTSGLQTMARASGYLRQVAAVSTDISISAAFPMLKACKVQVPKRQTCVNRHPRHVILDANFSCEGMLPA